MGLIFNRIEKRNPADPEGPKKWYVALKSRGVMSVMELAKELSDETTLNPMEARMTLYQLQKVVTKALLGGKTVDMGALGNFRLTLSSKGADDKESAGYNLVRKINLRFTASKPVKEAIAKANLSKAVDLVTER